jgi:hypothetical protein
MEKKITKKDRFIEMRTMFEEMGREDLVEFRSHEIGLLDKKSASRSKVDIEKAQVNADLTEIVVAVLEGGKKMTVTDIMKADDRLMAYSNQKIASVLKAGLGTLFIREEAKGKTLFSLV